MLCPLCEKDPCQCAPAADAAAGAAAPETKAAADNSQDQMMRVFQQLPDAPTPEQVYAWKQQYLDVYLIGFRADEFYVWRPLLRLEYKQLRANPSMTEDLLKEEVVRRCVLWPRLTVEFMSACRAGTIDTLFEVIMHGSNFIDPALAVDLVRKL